MGAVAYGIYNDMQQTIAHTKTSQRTLAIAMVSNTGGKIALARHTLERLAARPIVRRVDPNNCDRVLDDVYTLTPGYANVTYTNLDGTAVCSAVPQPGGKAVNVGKAPWFQTFLRERRFTVGHPFLGPITGKWVSVLSAPIWNERQEMVGGVQIPLDLNSLDPKIPAQFLASGSRYGFLDADRTMVWRNSDPEHVIGSRINSEAAQRIVEVRDGEFESVGVDGIRRFYSVVPLPETGWIAFVAVPSAEVYAPAKRRAIAATMIALAAILSLFLVAITIARRIARPVAVLKGAARAIQGGNLAVRAVPGGPSEIEEVAQGFNAMVAALQSGHEKLRKSELSYSSLVDNVPDYVMRYDRQHRHIFANEGAIRSTGKAREDFIGKTHREMGFPEHLCSLWEQAIDRCFGTGKPQTEIFEWDSAQGPVVLEWRAIPEFRDDGAVDTVLGLSRDITEIRRVEDRLKRFFALVPDLLCIASTDGRFLKVNSAWTVTLGFSEQEILDTPFIEFVHPDDRADTAAATSRQVAGEAVLNFTNRYRCKDGSYKWLEWRTTPVVNLSLIFATARDITESKRLEQEREQYFRFFRLSTDPMCIADPFGCFLQVNPAFVLLTGYAEDELVAKPFLDFVLSEDRQKTAEEMQLQVAIRPSMYFENRYVCKDGRIVVLSWTAYFDKKDGITYAAARDVTESKQSEERLKLASSVFSHAREGIMITDAAGTIIEVNDTFTQITSYSREEVVGRNASILKSGRQEKDFYAAMWRDLVDKGSWYGEIWNRRKNGQVYAEMLTISAVRDSQGSTQQYVALFSDITALKEHETQLERIAHYDALTTLPNRVLLADRMHQAMVQAQRRGQRISVAYIDLDGFKSINDNHGHETGDQLLMTVAARMKNALREGDTLARLGGDEFVALLLDLPDVEASVPMLTRLLSAAAESVHVGDLVLDVSASIGVTFYPQTEEVEADQLLRQADQAMYQAKLAGKNRYHVFDIEQDRSIRGHHEKLERIHSALVDEEFVLFYQPKVNMRTGRIIGAEALIRWQHPDKGLLLPAAFLPAIEDHPLAIELGEWVIATALSQLDVWRDAGLDIPVSVNVGARQLQHAGFVGRLRSLLAAHPKVTPEDLQLEVLETSALEDLARVSKIIGDCREIGVTFALDDFGTGYSSLTYLKRLPVTQLKIDQSFVRNMLDDPDDLAILEGVLGLSIAFRRQVIAEGVETVQLGAMLLQLGCEFAQGYGIAHPMPAHEFHAWSLAWRTYPSWSKLSAVSRDDLPLLFARVEHRAWIAAMELHLRGESAVPPPLDCHQCRFGKWLDREGLARYGGEPAFQAIEPLHQQVHRLAADLCQLAGQGRKPEALARVGELHDLRDALLQLLEALLEESRH